MDISEFRRELELVARVLDQPQILERITTVATLRLEGRLKRRAFSDGNATDGSKIGTYSTKPLYANSDAAQFQGLRSFRPLGSDGNATFKNGKPKKTRYFGDGYKGLRTALGRQNRTVDLNLTSDLANSMQTGTKDGKIVFGFVNERSRDLMKIFEQDKYKKRIADPNEQEVLEARDVANQEIIKIIRAV